MYISSYRRIRLAADPIKWTITSKEHDRWDRSIALAYCEILTSSGQLVSEQRMQRNRAPGNRRATFKVQGLGSAEFTLGGALQGGRF